MEVQKIFVDASFWIAILLTNEPNHEKLASLFKKLRAEGHSMFISNDVIDEVVTRMVYKNQFKGMEKFIGIVQQGIEELALVQLWVDGVVQEEAFRLVEKFYEHRMSLIDATSIVLMKRFKIDSILTLDEDFRKVGMKVLPV